MSEFTIIGAGITGNTAAISLAQAGHTVNVYERGPNPATVTQGQGRSINLAQSWRASDYFSDLFRKIGSPLPETTPMRSRLVHLLDGSQLHNRYNQFGQYLLSINRNDLNTTLCKAAQALGVKYHFHCATQGLDTERREVHMRKDVDSYKSVKYQYLLGCDGSNSTVAKELDRTHNQTKNPVLRSPWCYQEYEIKAKEVVGPEGTSELAYQLDNPEEFHIWVGPLKKIFLIALPNADKTFTLTLFCHEECEVDLEDIKQRGDIDAIKRIFSQLMPEEERRLIDIEKNFMTNAVSHIYSRNSAHWHEDSKDPHVLLLGDAAHAFPPFLGLGFNSCVEDVAIFMEGLKRKPNDTCSVIQEFASKRKADMHALRDASIDNANVIGENHPDDSLKFYITEYLERHYRNLFSDPHTMYSFHHMPESEARFRQQEQDAILGRLVEVEGLRTAFAEAVAGGEQGRCPITTILSSNSETAVLFKTMVAESMNCYEIGLHRWRETHYPGLLFSPYFTG